MTCRDCGTDRRAFVHGDNYVAIVGVSAYWKRQRQNAEVVSGTANFLGADADDNSAKVYLDISLRYCRSTKSARAVDGARVRTAVHEVSPGRPAKTAQPRWTVQELDSFSSLRVTSVERNAIRW